MGLQHVQVKPKVSSLQAQVKNSLVFRIYLSLARSWYRSQVGHCSQYSVERMLAFRDYCQRTSITRVVAVCLLTPIPALLAASLIDCIPLRPPGEGWRANKGLWVRLLLEAFAVAMGLISQVRGVIVTGTISNAGAVVISAGTSVCYVTIAIVVAAYWEFPVPFGFVISVAPVVSFFCLWTVLVVGPRTLYTTPLLRHQIKSQLIIVATQGLVGVLYPIFSTVFIRLSGVRQAAFVLVMPLIKYTTKQIIANAASSLHEYVGPVVVFSVDVFNVFYVAICMKSSQSLLTTLVMVAADGFHMFVALRTIFHLARVVKSRRIDDVSRQPNIDYVRDLPGMVRNVFLTSAATYSRIRVFTPFPLSLSEESVAFINEIGRNRRETHVYTTSKVQISRRERLKSVLGLQSSQQRRKTSTVEEISTVSVAPKSHQIAPASPVPNASGGSFQQGKYPPSRKQSISRKLAKLMRKNTVVASENTLRAAIGRRGVEEAAWEGLRALFHSEYLLMAEYVEAVLPML
ncbi:hypothetical protein PF008_g22140 [Phytophthora fragariae]|uniref:Uncharacterized protein n=1 Tax=Phytophthora fragariae TaxID=53985 RepID=A0A6G0QUI2_9STRA|nr:hypothetical protein PF008_g22140 [Phytophthora fragariae]